MNIYLKFTLKWLFRCILGLIVAGVIIFTWIRIQPPSLSFFDPYIRETLQPHSPEYTLTYKDIRTAWPKGRLVPGISITDARYMLNDETVLARFPVITVRLSLASLFLGSVKPIEIWLSRPEADLSHLAGSERAASAAAVLETLNSPQFFNNLFAFAERHKNFERLHAANGRLTLPGESAPINVDLPSVVLSMLHVQATPELILTASYAVNGQASRLQTVIHAPPEKGSDPGKVSESKIHFTNLHPPILAELSPDLAPLRGLDFKTQLELLFRVDASGRVDNLRFEMDSDAEGTLFHPEVWETPVPIEKLTAKGWLKNGFTQLKLASLHIESRGVTFDTTGTVDHLGKFDAVALDVRVDHLDPSRAHLYWPYQIFPVARNWIRDHFIGGEIHDATAKIRITPADLAAPVLPKGIIDVIAPFSDVAMKYHGKLLPITDAKGTARFTAHDITIDVAAARNYDSRALDGKVVIGKFTADPVTIDIRTTAKGPADDLRKVIDGLTGNTGYPIEIASGKAETRLSFQWPLSRFDKETFDYHAASKIQGFEIPNFQGYRWAQKTLLVSLDRNAVAVTGIDGELSPETAPDTAVPIKRIEAKGKLNYAPAGIEVSAFSTDLGGPVLKFSGVVTAADPYPRIQLEGGIDDLPFQILHQYWPRRFSGGLQKWLQTRVSDGNIHHADVRIDLDPAMSSLERLPATAVAVEGKFSGLRIDYFPPLPAIDKGEGLFTLSPDTAQVRFDKGSVGQSKIAATRIDITGIQNGEPEIDILAEIEGPASDLVEAARSIPGGAPMTMDLPPLVGAAAATRIHVKGPMDAEDGLKDVHYTIASKIAQITVKEFLGLHLTNGTAAVSFENDRFSVEGEIWSGQTPVSVRWEKNAEARETVHLSAVVASENHKDIRLPNLPFLKGTIQTDVNLTLTEDGIEVAPRIDFTQTAIDLRRWGWIKPVGTSAVLKGRSTLTDGNILTVSELILSGKKLDIQGSGKATFGTSTTVDVKLDPLNVGNHQLFGELTFDEKKGFQVNLTGSGFDAAGLLKMGKSSPPADPSTQPSQDKKTRPETVITFDIDKVFLANGVILNRPKGRIVWNGEKIHSVLIDGTFREEAPLHIAVTRKTNPEQILIQTSDAGTLLKGIDVYGNIRGGALVFDGQSENLLPTRKRVSGSIKIKDFLVVNAPGLVKVLSMASFVGALGQLQSGGIHFGTLDGNLTFENNIITLDGGRMEGISLAMTAEGSYDVEKRMSDIKGIVIPVNILNQVVDMIPILGKLIVGQGIIATDYTIKGPMDNPEVSIHPLTTLSVGFLRDVFKGFDFKAPGNADGTNAVSPGKKEGTPSR